MIDCEKCKYYHDKCDSRFRCRIDVEQIRADVIEECIDELKHYYDDDSWCIELLEQLKEQNDDKED